jgi:hypothetical protein
LRRHVWIIGHSLRFSLLEVVENEPHGDPLAGFVASLSPEQRRRLADLLVAGIQEQTNSTA